MTKEKARLSGWISEKLDREMRHEAIELSLRYPGEFIEFLWEEYKTKIKNKKEEKKMKINKKEFTNWLKNVVYHIMYDGRDGQEYRIYKNIQTNKYEFHSFTGSNWTPGNIKNLELVAVFPQNIDAGEMFDIPICLDEEGNSLGVYWENDPNCEPFTEDDFFTECFVDYFKETVDYNETLCEALDNALDDIREGLDKEKPLWA